MQIKGKTNKKNDQNGKKKLFKMMSGSVNET